MVNKEILNVQKRNSREPEPLNIEKIHEMVEYARGYFRCFFITSRNE